MSKTTILLADDRPVILKGLSSILLDVPGCKVIGECAGAATDIAHMVEVHKPDILIVDQVLYGSSVLLQELRHAAPLLRVLLFTDTKSYESVQQALAAGVAGYLLSDCSTSEIVRAVTVIAEGGRYFSPAFSRAASPISPPRSPQEQKSIAALTSREREVFRLAAMGKSYAEIGKSLFISPRTAESHRHHLMQKLGLKNLAEFILYAVRQGIITPDLEL